MSNKFITNATDDSFESEVLRADKPVLLDFWAPWCGPCRMIAPILDEIASEYHDRLKVVKINTEEHAQVATQMGVRGIPTLMIFKDGKHIATKVGALNRAQLGAFIDASIE